jgi:DNA-directed RNA polymerase subunit RPC12/RpoP
VSTFWKKCPKCGKRFEVKRIGERVTEEDEVVTIVKPQLMMSDTLPRDIPVSLGDIESELPPDNETVPAEKIITDDTYTCSNCGFTWTEEDEEFKDDKGHPLSGGEVVSEGAP